MMMVIDYPYWVFDLDGTLTIAVHDFDAIRRELGLKKGMGILEALTELPEDEANVLHKKLDELELELARGAQAAPGAGALLDALRGRGARLGILTRNHRDNALETLRAAGLEEYFEPEHVLGRREAPPKPKPDGVVQLLRRFRAPAASTLMVGDYLFDLQAGRAAGVRTLYVDGTGSFPFKAHADLSVTTLDQLLTMSGPIVHES
jgi:HAD superfamily hydrolase (TIGR01509 family)